ncbi:MAG: hypothetical protein GEV10_24465 [Streptosporangiales bacterium]|nr:hypothetical protein [Streptosporangiales bacterium]
MLSWEVVTVTDLGARYVAALAAKDTETLRGLFADDVYFRGLTPRRFWEAGSPDQVVHEVLYRWFAPTDVIEHVEHVDVGSVVDRRRVDYRFRVRNGDGIHTVEQRAYYDVDDAGRIATMHVMCAGYRPLESAAA